MKTLLLALALPLAACTSGTTSLMNNPNCTTKVNGQLNFGSITPTGSLRYSAVCKASEASPPVTVVPTPMAASEPETPR